MKAMRNDDFNTILELKMRGYQPSENTLKSLQPDISSTTFIAAVKIFQMEGVLKSLQDIKSAQSPITSGNKRNMEQTNLLFNFQFFSISILLYAIKQRRNLFLYQFIINNIQFTKNIRECYSIIYHLPYSIKITRRYYRCYNTMISCGRKRKIC